MESIDKKYYKIKEERLYQKVIAKTYKCNIQEDETLERILKKTNVYMAFLFSSLKSFPNALISRLIFAFFFSFSLLKYKQQLFSLQYLF